jgi:hypothetical protein
VDTGRKEEAGGRRRSRQQGRAGRGAGREERGQHTAFHDDLPRIQLESVDLSILGKTISVSPFHLWAGLVVINDDDGSLECLLLRER